MKIIPDPLVTPTRPTQPDFVDESRHYLACELCGQAFDCRDLWAVFYHSQPEHERLPVN